MNLQESAYKTGFNGDEYSVVKSSTSNTYFRMGSMNAYRYGFNGMERDDEAKGAGNSYTTPFRQYDPRLGRWLTIDPLHHWRPFESTYAGFGNNPIYFVDPSGLTPTNGGDDNTDSNSGGSTVKTDKVVAGKGAWDVANRNGITLDQLVAWNKTIFPQGIKSGTYMLHPGQELNVSDPNKAKKNNLAASGGIDNAEVKGGVTQSTEAGMENVGKAIAKEWTKDGFFDGWDGRAETVINNDELVPDVSPEMNEMLGLSGSSNVDRVYSNNFPIDYEEKAKVPGKEIYYMWEESRITSKKTTTLDNGASWTTYKMITVVYVRYRDGSKEKILTKPNGYAVMYHQVVGDGKANSTGDSIRYKNTTEYRYDTTGNLYKTTKY